MIYFFVFIFSFLITGYVRQYALRRAILDIPNERSSHHTPTPRGGGIAFVVTFLSSLFFLARYRNIDLHLVYALAGGGVLIALIGQCDDIFSVKNKWRILVHFIAAGWAIYWLNGFSFFDLGTVQLNLGLSGNLIAVVAIVWCINFYNFMDGIDGLASVEGIFVAVLAGTMLLFIGAPSLASLLYVLAMAIAGFAIWNWQPAKIFMGDIGSGFLGYIFAVLAFYTAKIALLPLTFWFIALAIFICDATFTLLHRVYKKKKWYTAHHEHAYQALTSAGASHKAVALMILLINIVLLLPVAFATIRWPSYAVWFISCTLIIFWLIWFGIKSRVWVTH